MGLPESSVALAAHHHCAFRFLVPPREKRPSVLPLWERPFCAPDDSLGALTSTAARSRILVLACLSPVRCRTVATRFYAGAVFAGC